jgi:MoxR-like ATPase
MAFYIPELSETIKALHRPIIIITSNAERQLPDAFLRRCVFHYINFPSESTMREIVDVHHSDIDEDVLNAAMKHFYKVRGTRDLRKPPSTSELLDWLVVLASAGVSAEKIKAAFPFAGVLLKEENDLSKFKREVE